MGRASYTANRSTKYHVNLISHKIKSAFTLVFVSPILRRARHVPELWRRNLILNSSFFQITGASPDLERIILMTRCHAAAAPSPRTNTVLIPLGGLLHVLHLLLTPPAAASPNKNGLMHKVAQKKELLLP